MVAFERLQSMDDDATLHVALVTHEDRLPLVSANGGSLRDKDHLADGHRPIHHGHGWMRAVDVMSGSETVGLNVVSTLGATIPSTRFRRKSSSGLGWQIRAIDASWMVPAHEE